MAKFVNNGGTILIMQQSAYPEGLFPANLTDHRSTVAYKRALDSEMLGDIRDDDLQMWRGDNIVSEKDVAKPTGGCFKAILDSGGRDGLTYLPLVEIFSGKGRYILCQLSIIRESEEPVANIILENTINYALKAQEVTLKTGIVQDKVNIKGDIETVGAMGDDLNGQLGQKNLKDYGVIIADSSASELAGNIQKLKDYVNNGGKVLLHGLTPDYLEKLKGLFPEEINLSQSKSVPVNIFQEDSSISGMTNQDLYWLGEPASSFYLPTSLSQEIMDYVITKPLPELEECQIIEAEDMKPEDEYSIIQDDWVYMYTGSTLSTKISIPESSDYLFAIRASGTPYHGGYPEVTILVDGIRKVNINLENPDWEIYSVLVYMEAGEHNVSLVFTNDAYDPVTKEDRNLSLDKLIYTEVDSTKVMRLLSPAALVKIPMGKGFYLIDQINWHGKTPSNDKAARYLTNLLVNLGVPFEDEIGALTISGAKMKPADDLQMYSTSDQVAHLAMNGYIYSDVKFASDGEYTFKVRASGTEAGGEYPNVRLMIDTDTIGDQMLHSPGWETLAFKTSVKAGFHRVSIVFTNDYWEPPKDRNLDIEWIRVR